MFDIEEELFDKVATAVISEFPNCYCVNRYQRIPRKFPCLMLYEADNMTDNMNGSNAEKSSVVMYEMQVFSNDLSDSKAEAKAISNKADSVLTVTGFRRNSRLPMPNLEDATVYRLTSRYSAEIANNKVNRR